MVALATLALTGLFYAWLFRAARHPEIKSLNEVTTALLERALQIDPNFAAVYAELAHEYRDRAF